MVRLTVLDARCYVCGHLISGPTTLHTDTIQVHLSCEQCSSYTEARIAALEAQLAERVKLLDPDMPAQQLRMHLGEMTAQELRTARAAIRLANSALSALEATPPAPPGWSRETEDDGSDYLNPPPGWLKTELTAPPAPKVTEVRPLDDWHEDYGDVVWWARLEGEWIGEAAWIGTPNDSDWPGYHTHWSPHPPFPAALTAAQEAGKP